MEKTYKLFIDMDGVIADFKDAMKTVKPEMLLNHIDKETGKVHYEDIPGIFKNLKPIDGAINAIKTLATKFDVYILSTAPWDNASAWGDKVNWIKQYLDDVCHKKVILTHNKDLLCKDETCFLVDDRTVHGADKFGPNLIQFGSEKFPTWQAVIDYLIKQI